MGHSNDVIFDFEILIYSFKYDDLGQCFSEKFKIGGSVSDQVCTYTEPQWVNGSYLGVANISKKQTVFPQASFQEVNEQSIE